jgi:hypothetical protein
MLPSHPYQQQPFSSFGFFRQTLLSDTVFDSPAIPTPGSPESGARKENLMVKS